MPGAQITKKIMADAMKEIMAQTPMDKIRVGDIVKHCDMSRQSFYYHFKDKYDLVNWIFYTEFVSSLKKELNRNGRAVLESICEFFYNNSGCYRNALSISGQNSFSDYLKEVIHAFVMYDYGGYFMDDENKEFCVTFLTDAICTSITRWLLEGTKIEPKEFVRLVNLTVLGISSKVANNHSDDDGNRESHINSGYRTDG